jgi:phage repressor protein C with HTH and peptisase S24 domain
MYESGKSEDVGELACEYSGAYNWRMVMAQLVQAILDRTGWTQEQLAADPRLKTTQVTVSRWLAGSEPRGDKRDALRQIATEAGVFPDDPKLAHIVPIMGRIGAGAEIEPDFEQMPPDGIDQVELPFAVPADMIGFMVKGDSMLPKYDDGDVVVVHREQQRSTTSLIGEEAAVRTQEGRRYLKRIMPGSRRNSFYLESTNARTIEASIAWASEIFAIVPAKRLRRVERKVRPLPRPPAKTGR